MLERLEKVKENPRYKNFKLLTEPVAFDKLFARKDYDVVQLHSIDTFGDSEDDFLGFCGVCSWKGHRMEPLDGDTYMERMSVYGYHEFSCEEGRGLDILVLEW